MASLPHTFEKSHVIVNGKDSYIVLNKLGKGSFGKVVKCLKRPSNETVAIKYMKKDNRTRLNEVKSSLLLQERHLHEKNIIKFIGVFTKSGNSCLEFELLDQSIFRFMRHSQRPLRVSEIRIISQQMLVALEALENIKLVHADIKPDNIMLVNHKDQPYRVKLIDFGMAGCPADSNFNPIQAIGYRAPEGLLGLPKGHGIDMWALGASLGLMFIAEHLFPSRSEYFMMESMVHMLGKPENNMLDSASKAELFFNVIDTHPERLWTMKTLEEYAVITGNPMPERTFIETELNSFENLELKHLQITDCVEKKDMYAFIDLLKRMLSMDQSKRITPSEALQHTFITMSHLCNDPLQPYAIQELKNIETFLPDHQTLCRFSFPPNSDDRTVVEIPHSMEEKVINVETNQSLNKDKSYSSEEKFETTSSQVTSGNETNSSEEKVCTCCYITSGNETHSSEEELISTCRRVTSKNETHSSEEGLISTCRHVTSKNETHSSEEEVIFTLNQVTSENETSSLEEEAISTFNQVTSDIQTSSSEEEVISTYSHFTSENETNSFEWQVFFTWSHITSEKETNPSERETLFTCSHINSKNETNSIDVSNNLDSEPLSEINSIKSTSI